MAEKEDVLNEPAGEMKAIRASGTDIDKVWGVVKSCADWLLTQKGLDHWSSYYTREIIEKKIKTQEVLLIYEGDEVVGTMSLDSKPVGYYTEKNLSNFADPTAKAVYVSIVAVRPEFQRRGIASRLMESADEITKSRGIAYIRFDCRKEYVELVNFYQKRGYKIVGSFSEGEDQNYLLMEKKVI